MQKKILSLLAGALFSVFGSQSLLANTHKTHWCIVGGTRGAGYALAENL
ncbi:MAG: hypothetical protein QG632_650, partial [Candidatus Dependentiae bacterium]|nr:hypothetical protein [Candidatus Dependentiae bacterium]